MGKIYVNQTNLIINFDLGADITGGTVEIDGKDPKGVAITPLTVSVIDALNGKVQFVSTATPKFTMAGDYKLWASVTYLDGKQICGEPSILKIFQKGT